MVWYILFLLAFESHPPELQAPLMVEISTKVFLTEQDCVTRLTQIASALAAGQKDHIISGCHAVPVPPEVMGQ